MNGVDILTSTEVATEFAYNWWLAGWIFVAIVMLGGVVGFCASRFIEKIVGATIGCLVAAILGSLIFVIAVDASEKPIAYETQYKITVSDDVKMAEFMEKYEIIDQDGKIYTVRERE